MDDNLQACVKMQGGMTDNLLTPGMTAEVVKGRAAVAHDECKLVSLWRFADAPYRKAGRVVLDTLETQLGTKDVAHWHQPRGGYFVSVNLMDGCAKRTVELLKEAGVVMTAAGATYPYGNDPRDRNIRIAPTLPPVEELKQAVDVLCTCIKLATLEKLGV